jgi:WD40 repeat protein
MKSFFIVLLFLFSLVIQLRGQEFNKSLNKDSLLSAILKDVPEPRKSELKKMYNDGNEQAKEFFLVMFSMQNSSKKELISNIDSNYEKINFLKSSYLKLVPDGYIVSIEFNPENKVVMTKESIDLKVEHVNNNQNDIKQEWDLEYGSAKLAEMIKSLGWTSETLTTIRRLLSDANCVSIENGGITTIGFARSGMGKYSYKLFDSDLTREQIEQYNNGCTYIFYKKNIVLQYGGGAVGPQCFPDG